MLVYRESEVPATDKETLDMAASADVAVIFVGTDQTQEERNLTGSQ